MKIDSNVTPPHKQNNVKYSSLDGLRAYAAVGIVMMHVLANIEVKPTANVWTERVIPWFSDFTLLFMIISAFGICCGYYERIKSGLITPGNFYAKRYQRTWPFFALMVIISFVMEPGWATFCQSFANLTMCFNLLPNPKIEVIGVGWFLGTVFTFYMLFPFFTFLLDNKRRGWVVLGLSLLFCYLAIHYFSNPEMVVTKIGRVNIIYSAPFFIAGGLVFLYRDVLQRWTCMHTYVGLAVCVLATVLRLIFPMEALFVIPDMVVFILWLIYAIGSHSVVLNNSIAKYLGGISMEIYLCHMMFYRFVSLFHLERFFDDSNVLYVVTFAATLIGAICFSHVVKYHAFPFLINFIERNRNKSESNENLISQ